MRMYDVIEKKRDGGELTDAEIDYFVSGYVAGENASSSRQAVESVVWWSRRKCRARSCPR